MTEFLLLAALTAVVVLGRKVVKSRQERQTETSRWSLVVQSSTDFLWYLDSKLSLQSVNDRVWDWCEPLPGGVQELYDRRWEFVWEEDQEALREAYWRFRRRETDTLDLVFRATLPGARERWLELRAVRHLQTSNLIGSLRDITGLKDLEHRVWELTHLDPLTGLSNRLHLLETFEGEEPPVCFLYICVDNFSVISEANKRQGGDTVLQWLAQKFRSIFRTRDLISRWGPDDFVVAVRGSEHLAKTLAQRIHETLASAAPNSSAPWGLSVSVGIVPWEAHGDLQTTLTMTKEAVHRAQAAGRQRTVVFDETLGAEAERRIRLEWKLTEALRTGELRMVFQPQFRLSDRTLIGFEALARWHDSEMGEISPNEFIPIAEALGLIAQLGRWSLAQACSFLARQSPSDRNHLKVSVNVSVVQLKSEDFVAETRRIVEESGLSPCCVELEITETILVQSFEDAVSKLSELRAEGFRIALDDFGKGYSSLSYLKGMPLDTLKIDKEFVGNHAHQDLLGAIIQLGRLLKLQVVAEGIEEEHQVEHLVKSGCHSVQGYYFSRPLERDDAEILLKRR